MREPLIQLINTTLKVDNKKILDQVEMTVYRGELLVLMGGKSSGKTSVIEFLSGIKKPSQGMLELFGTYKLQKAKQKIGSLVQGIGFPPMLTVREIIYFVQSHFPEPMGMKDLLVEWELLADQKKLIKALSPEKNQILALALAFVGQPELLILDEPTTGLNEKWRKKVWKQLQKFVLNGGTVFLTTPYLDEAEVLGTRVFALNEGRVIIQDNFAELKAFVTIQKMTFECSKLPPLEGVMKQEQNQNHFTLYTRDADALMREMVEKNVPFRDVKITPLGVEEALRLLGEEKSK